MVRNYKARSVTGGTAAKTIFPSTDRRLNWTIGNWAMISSEKVGCIKARGWVRRISSADLV